VTNGCPDPQSSCAILTSQLPSFTSEKRIHLVTLLSCYTTKFLTYNAKNLQAILREHSFEDDLLVWGTSVVSH